jgi:hypothetical protein
MRICGYAAEGLRGERRLFELFPSKELQDFWGNRPKLIQEVQAASSSVGASQDWMSSQKSEDPNEPPPPPYTLEPESAAPSTTMNSTATISGAPSSLNYGQQSSTAEVRPLHTSTGHLVSSTTTSNSSSINNESQLCTSYAAPFSTTPAEQRLHASPDSVNQLSQEFAQQRITPVVVGQGNFSRPPGSDHPPQRNTSIISTPSFLANRPPLHPSHPSANSVSSGASNSRPTPSPPPRPSPQPHSTLYSTGPTATESRVSQGATPNHYSAQSTTYNSYPNQSTTPSPYSGNHTAFSAYPSHAATSSPYPGYSERPRPPTVGSPALYHPPHLSSPYRPLTMTPQTQPSLENNPSLPSSTHSPEPPSPPSSIPYPIQCSPNLPYHEHSSVAAGKRPERQVTPQQWPPAEWKASSAQQSSFSDNRPQVASPPPAAPSPIGAQFNPPLSLGFRPSPVHSPSTHLPGTPGVVNPPLQYNSSYDPNSRAHTESYYPGQWNAPPSTQNSMFPVPGQPGYGHHSHSPSPSTPYSSSYPSSPSFPQASQPSYNSTESPHPPYHQVNSASSFGLYGKPQTSNSPSEQYRHDSPGLMPPPPPPRPTSTGPAASQTGRPPASSSYAPTLSQGNSGMKIPGFAANALDKFAGAQQRQQLESTVTNLAKSSSKLFSKFTK